MFERVRLLLLRLVPGPVLRLFEGFWATPLVMALLCALLAAAVETVPRWLIGPGVAASLGGIDPEGARATLSTIAGGMISLVALVFSLTFVALGTTTGTLGPRVSDFVLASPSAQTLAGLALGTFLYAALVLSVGEATDSWRLGIAVWPALVLAAATLVMTVVFAHAMTRTIRVEEMVARLGHRFVSHARSLREPPVGCAIATGFEDFERNLEGARSLAASQPGYVGAIDYAAILHHAVERDLRVALDVRESAFLLPGVPFARVLGPRGKDDDADAAVEAALNLTDRRETAAGASYEAAALSEAALRALSPGINDPATAIACVNRLFEGLAVLAEADRPRLLGGEDEAPRLARPPLGVPEILADALDPVIEASRGNAQLIDRMLALARQLDPLLRRARDREALAAFADRVAGAARPQRKSLKPGV